MSKRGRYLVELAMKSTTHTFENIQSSVCIVTNNRGEYSEKEGNVVPSSCQYFNDFVDTDKETIEHFNNLQTLCNVLEYSSPSKNGSNSCDDKADNEMMYKEDLQLTKNPNNEINSENPVSPKFPTELKPVREDKEMMCEKDLQINSEKSAPPRIFTDLQPVGGDYLEDSPVDDSDLDPDYDPSVEAEKKNDKKLTFLALNKRMFSDAELRRDSTDDEDDNENKKTEVTRVKKRMRTESEKTERNLLKYQLLPECKCQKRCFDFFSIDERKHICESFWRLDFGERRQYLNAYVKKNIVQQRRTGSNNKRQWSLTYSMIKGNEGIEKKVCKTMFLHTHGLKTDGMITQLICHQNKSKGLQIAKDGRGKATPPNKKDVAMFRDHINSFNPQVSHYKLEHAPNRRYLPSDISITDMWKDFCEKKEKVSYERYRHEVHSENIGFDQPNQDDCNVCVLQKEHAKVCDNLVSASDAACSSCISFDVHHELYKQARAAYQEDRNKFADKDQTIISVDMQKILLLPKMSLKSSVFISRLVVFNETFAAVNKPLENICILWHEAISGRNAEDVAFTYYAIIKRAPGHVKHYVFWCDNCSAQNKNWKLYAALCSAVNATWGPETVTFKYSEAGHSFMKADVVHGQIGKALKKRSNVYDFHDLNEIILKTSRHNKTLLLNFEDFYEFKEGSRQRKSKDNSKSLPILSTIKVVQFQKGSRSLFFKTNHTHGEFLCADFLRPKYDMSIPETKRMNRGINPAKKQKILKDLVPSMPPVKRLFWEQLPISDKSCDLLSNQ